MASVSQVASADRQPNAKKRKRKDKTLDVPRKRRFIYGNYDHYYGYRILKAVNEDPRLKYFKKDWFEGKDCLDVGCNTGNLTIAVARKFLCRTMLGIDIDPVLAGRAQKLLEHTARRYQKKPLDNRLDGTISKEISSLDERNHTNACSEASIGPGSSSLCDGWSGDELLRRVTFRTENFIDCLESSTATYDTLLCLSVTKWVHLNWGDDGLIRLFAKMKLLLRPGGILVLEPQPWKSYKNKCHVSEVIKKNFKEIVLRPKHFQELLLEKVGYRSMESITEVITDSIAGFSRPIFLLRT